MPLDRITQAVPALQDRLNQLPAVAQIAPLWALLERLLVAHAPSGGANLPGAIGEEIARLAVELDLGDRMIAQLGATGNAAVWIGADQALPDVVVVAHMDRPSFRVRSVEDGRLFAICANRFAAGEQHVPAKAVRFEDGRLIVGAQGVLIAAREADGDVLRFEARRGALRWQDTVMIDAYPTLDGETVVGTGLDNCLGVLLALLAAAALRGVEETLRAQGRRCLFVFTDQEEGPPEGFFGHGAARLAYAVPVPTTGCVIVDGQNAGPSLAPQLGAGVCHGTASGWGRGSIVPPNYCALAVDLAEALNAQRPGTVQFNTGYLSRSDDMILGRWAPILALIGAPLTDPHTAHESARLGDLQAGVWWLTHYLAAVLRLAPELGPRYALGR